MNSIFFRSWCSYVPCLQHSVCSLLLTPRTEVHGYKMFRAYGSIRAKQFSVMIEYNLRGAAQTHNVTTEFSLLADRQTWRKREK
jgi:hypothetical protein